MAYCVTIDFNEDLFMSILTEQLQSLLFSSVQEVIARRYPFWSVEDGTKIESYADGTGTVGYTISTDNAIAFVLEFGSGEFMDESNPYLDDYKKSVYWNRPYRTGPSIVTRPEGVYQSFNWETGRPEMKEASGDLPPGFKTRYQGEEADPQIGRMVQDVADVFMDKVDAEASDLIMSVLNMRGNAVFKENREVIK